MQEVQRLTPETYRAVEKAIGGASVPIVNQTTTALQAAEALGVQRVLKVLRDGFVIGV